MYIIDGKEVSKTIKNKVKEEIMVNNYKPCLLVIMVGNNPASLVYISSKEKACNKAGIEARTIMLPENTSQKELIDVIEKANNDKTVHAILVQLPLPNHMDTKEVIDTIKPEKDVDGLTSTNQGKLVLGNASIIPCTPKGILSLFDAYNIDLTGKNAVVIGRSSLVGKPTALVMLQRNATVTMAHSKTKNLKEICLNSDIIVCAVGKPKLITADMVKEGAIVIDVGINRVYDTIVGDVDYYNVSKLASRITPVPGGVGPMTIASLLENVVECYKIQKKIK